MGIWYIILSDQYLIKEEFKSIEDSPKLGVIEMKNEVNENVLILTATFSCAISVLEEEIIIKKPSHEQQSIEQIIIGAEQQAYMETLAEYKNNTTLSNFIMEIPGFEDTYQQRLDMFIEPYGIIRVFEEGSSVSPLVIPFTSGLNINAPILYTTAHCTIINARGASMTSNDSNTSIIGKAENLMGSSIYHSNTDLAIDISSSGDLSTVKETNWTHYHPTANLTGVSINDSGISFNITKAFNSWNRASMKH